MREFMRTYQGYRRMMRLWGSTDRQRRLWSSFLVWRLERFGVEL